MKKYTHRATEWRQNIAVVASPRNAPPPRKRATEWRRNIAVGASPRKVVAADTRPRPPAAATPSSLEGEPGWEEEGEPEPGKRQRAPWLQGALCGENGVDSSSRVPHRADEKAVAAGLATTTAAAVLF